jgi:hypothetical protein
MSPLLPELYMMKAQVLRWTGDQYGAVCALDDSRELNAQDRFVNIKSDKYCLQAEMLHAKVASPN